MCVKPEGYRLITLLSYISDSGVHLKKLVVLPFGCQYR